MKKLLDTDNPQGVALSKVLYGYFMSKVTIGKKFSHLADILKKFISPQFRKIFSVIIILTFTVPALAPDNKGFIIPRPPLLNPYKPLMYAIGMVETFGNTLAYNEFENAAGIFQIRQVRIDDYNRRTGSNYVIGDMFDYDVSEKIFLYFAALTGPYNFEKIAKAWNGSGPMTEYYWQRIKKYLK